MKRITTFFIITISSTLLYSQIEQTSQSLNTQFSRYEIGFSFGAFPLVGFIIPPKDRGLLPIGGYGFSHTSYQKNDNGTYEKMYNLGSYKLNCNYHWQSERSVGISLSWVGRHIDKYDMIGNDTIDSSGWNHYFSLLANYRRTYYLRKNLSIYWGIHGGIIFCIRDKDILYKRNHTRGWGYINNDPFYINPALHITAFGIEFGTKYVFNMELGIGALGILNTGFKYRF